MIILYHELFRFPSLAVIHIKWKYNYKYLHESIHIFPLDKTDNLITGVKLITTETEIRCRRHRVCTQCSDLFSRLTNQTLNLKLWEAQSSGLELWAASVTRWSITGSLNQETWCINNMANIQYTRKWQAACQSSGGQVMQYLCICTKEQNGGRLMKKTSKKWQERKVSKALQMLERRVGGSIKDKMTAVTEGGMVWQPDASSGLK